MLFRVICSRLNGLDLCLQEFFLILFFGLSKFLFLAQGIQLLDPLPLLQLWSLVIGRIAVSLLFVEVFCVPIVDFTSVSKWGFRRMNLLACF